MKYFLFFFLLLIACSPSPEKDLSNSDKTLNIASIKVCLQQDDFSKALQRYEKKYGYKINIDVYPNLDSLFSDIDSTTVDIILGLNNILVEKVIQDSFLISAELSNFRYISENLIFDQSKTLVPIFYSPLAFIYDERKIENVPRTFGAIQDGKFKDKIILQDPATSEIGKAILIWSVAAFGTSGYRHFWRSIKDNVYQIVAHHNEAYDRLLAAEAPIIISYRSIIHKTEHISSEQNFVTFIPTEGSFNCIYAAGIMKNSSNIKAAEIFLNYLLSEKFQRTIFSELNMIPVHKDIDYPSFQQKQTVNTDLTNKLEHQYIGENYQVWQKRWQEIMHDE